MKQQKIARGYNKCENIKKRLYPPYYWDKAFVIIYKNDWMKLKLISYFHMLLWLGLKKMISHTV